MVTTWSAKLNRLQDQSITNTCISQNNVESTTQTVPSPINLPPIPAVSMSHVATQMDAMMAPQGFPMVIPPNLAPHMMPTHLPKNFGLPPPRPFKTHWALYQDIVHKCHSRGYILFGVVFHYVRRAGIWVVLLTCTQHVCRLAYTSCGLPLSNLAWNGSAKCISCTYGIRQGPTKDINSYIHRFKTIIT